MKEGAIESKPLSLLLFSRDSCPLIFSLPFPSLFVAAAVLFTPLILSALIFILILCFALLLSSAPHFDLNITLHILDCKLEQTSYTKKHLPFSFQS